MFCQKCGTQLPDNSNFCTTCGHAFNSSHKIQINYSDVASTSTDFLKSLFLSPIKCCSEYSSKLSSTFAYLYFAIATLVFSIITTIYLKVSIKSSILSAIKSTYMDGLGSYFSDGLMESSAYISNLLDTFLPFFKTFFSITLAFVLFFGSIALVSYIIHNLAFKAEVPLNEYFVVASVALTLQGVALIVSMLLLTVVPIVSIIFLSIASILIAVVLYTGLSNLKDEHSSDPYIFSILYSIISYLTSYIMIKLIVSGIFNLLTDYLGGSLSDIFSYL